MSFVACHVPFTTFPVPSTTFPFPHSVAIIHWTIPSTFLFNVLHINHNIYFLRTINTSFLQASIAAINSMNFPNPCYAQSTVPLRPVISNLQSHQSSTTVSSSSSQPAQASYPLNVPPLSTMEMIQTFLFYWRRFKDLKKRQVSPLLQSLLLSSPLHLHSISTPSFHLVYSNSSS